MPYLMISTQIRLESGPTVVGDEWSDPELMEYLEATLLRTLGNNFLEWRTADCPRVVLNKLERRGYHVVSMTGINQTCVWTLHKPCSNDDNDNVNSNMMLTTPPSRSPSSAVSDKVFSNVSSWR